MVDHIEVTLEAHPTSGPAPLLVRFTSTAKAVIHYADEVDEDEGGGSVDPREPLYKDKELTPDKPDDQIIKDPGTYTFTATAKYGGKEGKATVTVEVAKGEDEYGYAWDFISDCWSDITDGVEVIWNAFVDGVQSLWDFLVSPSIDGYQNLTQSINLFLEEFDDGLAMMDDTIEDALIDVAYTIEEGIEALLGIDVDVSINVDPQFDIDWENFVDMENLTINWDNLNNIDWGLDVSLDFEFDF